MGLLVAPSWAGLSAAIAVVAAFLTRRPLRVIQTDWRRTTSPRRDVAWRFALGYGLIALAGAAATIARAGLAPLAPLLGAAPLLAVFLIYDFMRQGRSWQAEMAGATAFAAVAAVIPLIAGWSLYVALALAFVVVARVIPSVLYVRARLRLERGKPHSASLVVGMHALGLAVVTTLASFGALPLLAVAAFAVLLVRAIVGLSRFRRKVRVNTIGFTEVGYGVLTVLAVGMGLR